MSLLVVGKRVPTKEAYEQVTGKFKYAGDLRVHDLHTGVIVRSKYPYAQIVDIRTEKARKLRGVRLILTANDVGSKRFGRYLKDQPLFAKNTVLYVGEPVAGIVAIDEETAEAARDLLEIEYEPLKGVLDASEALREDSRILHPDLSQYNAMWSAIKYGNVCSETSIVRGNMEDGFARSQFIIENVFETQIAHQCPIETQVAIAQRDDSGRMKVVMPTQLPFGNQILISECLQIEPSRVSVVAMPSGGSFGSKLENIAGIYAALLSWHSEKPVRIKFSRREEFVGITPRHASRIRLKSGVKKDGTLMAWKADIVFDTGAYAWAGPIVTAVCTMFSVGPYRVPNIELVGKCVYTNKVPCGAFRGYGNPQAAFAHESQMDIIAKTIGIDPLDIRLKNAVEDGDIFTLGTEYRNVTLKQTLKAVAGNNCAETGRKRRTEGIGIACFQHVTGALPSSIVLKVNLDGTISLFLGTPSIGTSISTIACQIVSEELSIPYEDILVVPINTESSPYDHGLGISRGCYNVGHATKIACEDLKEQIIAVAAEMFAGDRKNIVFRDGKVFLNGENQDRSLALREVFSTAFYKMGGPLIGRGSYVFRETPREGTCRGMPISTFAQITFGSQIAKVSIDAQTGKIKVLKIAAAHDVGKALNPAVVEGQIYGGIVQGVGYALLEEVKLLEGKPVNDNLRDYKLPTALDVPKIEIVLIEEPDGDGPYGAKGVGEPPIIGVAPAIANAVDDAIGVRIKQLPITPEKVVIALKTRRDELK